jgi:SSS family solute:Na+ symporter
MVLDIAVIAAYLLGMVVIGWWGAHRAGTRSDYLVAGRRLGPLMYAGTLSAVVLGGASTVGGVGLGYEEGLSGAWLVLTIGLGVLLISAVLAGPISRLRVYTVAEMLALRYGGGSTALPGAVMWAYTLMLAVTNTLAFAALFTALFDLPRAAGVALGGGVVVLYSTLGGMWSVTLTDIAQFAIQTAGIFAVLLPVSLLHAGGPSGIAAKLGPQALDLGRAGPGTIATYLLTYVLGLLIGQDIWQRVATARTPGTARGAGIGAGIYCVLYALAGALIGTAARALHPGLANPDDAFTAITRDVLPAGLRGLVLAAALAAVMSTASGGLIACATVAARDIGGRRSSTVRTNRLFTLLTGVLAIAVAIAVDDVVSALTAAYNVLVAGLLVPIVGGLLWKRGTRPGALAAMFAGSVAVVAAMVALGTTAGAAIYWGLGASLAAHVVVSLATAPTDDAVLQRWRERLAGASGETEEAGRQCA